MAKIKEGYDGQELEIKFEASRNRHAMIWIIQKAFSKDLKGLYSKYGETLSYASLQELNDLKREIEDAILTITGIDRSY